MTTHRLVRCKHCLDVYEYQSSGWGCLEAENSSEYCPTCKKAINKALENVPPKFDVEWVDDPTISLESVLKAEEDHKAEYEAKHGVLPYFKAVAVPAFDLNDWSNSNRNGFVRMGDKEVYYSYWSKTNHPGYPKVQVKMEKNLQTGQLSPWREYRDPYR